MGGPLWPARFLRAAAAIAALLLPLLVSARGLAVEVSDRFCIVPVKNGAPGQADLGDVHRMAFRVVMLPGVSRPVIYAFNRGGVWTIGEENDFVPFGGAFPELLAFDRFVPHPITGDVLGWGNSLGIYRIRPGERTFDRLLAVDGKPLRGVRGLNFVPRLNRFVVSDKSGLYLMDADGKLSDLGVEPREHATKLSTIFDLPELGAILFNAESSPLLLRWDDGETIELARVGRWDFVREAAIDLAAQELVLRMHTTTWRLPLPSKFGKVSLDALAGPGRDFTLKDAGSEYHGLVNPPPELDIGEYVYRLEAPSLGKTLVWADKRLFEVKSGVLEPVGIPVHGDTNRVEDVIELPASKAALIMTGDNVFVLEADGRVSEVPGGRAVGEHDLRYDQGIIPVRNMALIMGRRALYLGIDRTISGANACLSGHQ